MKSYKKEEKTKGRATKEASGEYRSKSHRVGWWEIKRTAHGWGMINFLEDYKNSASGKES